MIASAFEHPAVLEPCRLLERRGVEVTYLPVDGDGIVRPEALAAALRPTARLVSVTAANDVVGTVQPVAELAMLTRNAGALFHTERCGAGELPFDVGRVPVDLLSLSVAQDPQTQRDKHTVHNERSRAHASSCRQQSGTRPGLRSATENIAGIVGFGQAALLARVEVGEESARLVRLRDRVVAVTEQIDGAYVIGRPYKRLPGHLCLGFSSQPDDAIDCCSHSTTPASRSLRAARAALTTPGNPPYVLTAMGFDTIRARGSLRVTMGSSQATRTSTVCSSRFPAAAESLASITSHAGFGVRSKEGASHD